MPDTSIFEKIPDLIKSSERPHLFVFDVDSTLFDVSQRHTHILRDYAKSFLIRWFNPSLSQKLRTAVAMSHDWGYDESLVRARIKLSSGEQKKLHKFWHSRFFSEDYLGKDVPYDGAINYLNFLVDSNCEIIYLTGRHESKMLQGTLRSFQDHGVPFNETSARVKLKDQASVPDEDFKLQYLLNIDEKKYEKIWFIENEPVNLNVVAKYLPNIELVYFDSVHSGREEVIDKAHVVSAFPKL